MYRGFCITEETIKDLTCSYFNANGFIQKKYEEVLSDLDKKSTVITSTIAKILQGDALGIVDGDALQQACMPTSIGKYDVFVSHSHNSEKSAKDLAAYLKTKYGVRCFVDGFVWGSCDKDILRPIDNKWSRHDSRKDSYSYEKRNFSTSHVHAMLSMALLEMIDQCECCIFIKPKQEYNIEGINDMTLSPWIYEEISMFNKVAKQIPNRVTRIQESFSAINRGLKVRYKLDLSNISELKKQHLQVSFPDDSLSYTKTFKWLDYIYENVK